MTKPVFAIAMASAAVLTFNTAARAQSIDPTVYGELFCELRAKGVTLSTARAAAVEAAYRPERVRTDEDARAAAQYVIRHCYEAAK